jgi:malonyl-CoA O-methyltransferase
MLGGPANAMHDPDREFIPVREGYDRWSAVYDHDGNPLVALEETFFEGILPPLANAAVLDLGCGTGRHAIRLAQRGARVTAVDFSTGMLAAARARPGAEHVAWREHDLRAPMPFAPATFDLVVSSLVLEHLTELGPFFAEVHRILRPGGVGAHSTIHPALALRGSTARFTDPHTEQVVHLESRPQPLSELVMAALRAGLTIDHLSEHTPDRALAARFPRAEKYLGWPMLVLMRLVR